MDTISLPKLNHLTPTFSSTLLKAVEEAGELARAVLHFLPYGRAEEVGQISAIPSKAVDLTAAQRTLRSVAEELLDVAQVCVTMLFVMEDEYHLTIDRMIDRHLAKLMAKGYCFDQGQTYEIATCGSFKTLRLPRLYLDEVTLLTTVCKIQEELGEMTQYLGKMTGASGETVQLDFAAALDGCAEELLDVAQCCFTMMYILADRYQVDIAALVAEHVEKLEKRGYFTR
ncbi:MAG: MazG nucleotide pyrophosphohydrolase domain-containing protein [Sporomusaceae bacterium]|nr:MazG nucleotide pyrophosphohydrolase domain-containing protein [Sporomusaceae bacterium]